MQLSQLLNPTSPYEQPKVPSRFARYIEASCPAAFPSTSETRSLLGKADKFIFGMITYHQFDNTLGCIRLTAEQFAVALWKTSLLRQVTRRGRKGIDDLSWRGIDPLFGKNLASTSVWDFFNIDDDAKEVRCMRVWKNLRKYLRFKETQIGWDVYHEVFRTAVTPEAIPRALKDILPLKKKSNRRCEPRTRNEEKHRVMLPMV